MFLSQMYAMKQEISRINNSGNFELSPQSRDEYGDLTDLDWQDLVVACQLFDNLK